MISVRDLLTAQHGVFAVWQLVAGGWPARRAERLPPRLAAIGGLRGPHDGVYVTGHAPLTDAQRWWAATLTAPWTVLEGTTAAAAQALGLREDGLLHVVRPGRTSPYTAGTLHVRYSSALRGQVVRAPAGFRITRPERTIIDVWPGRHERIRRKVLREGLRTRQVTVASMTTALDGHRGRRGIASLREVVAVYARLQLERCRSDAEAYAMEVLHAAGLELPDVNELVAGEEADLSWPGLRRIIEIDGPQWHRLRDEDARRTAIWQGAGQLVRRISSDTVFRDPGALVALATSLGVPRVRRTLILPR